MKGFFTMLLAIVACLCLVQSTNAWQAPRKDDRNACFKRNPDVGNAVESFCWGNKNMVSA